MPPITNDTCRSNKIRERLVNVEGRHDLANDLAKLYTNKALVVMNTGNNQVSVALFDQTIAIFGQLIESDGRKDLICERARAEAIRGVLLIQMGDTVRGKTAAKKAIAVLRAEVDRTGRADLKAVLDWTAGNVGV